MPDVLARAANPAASPILSLCPPVLPSLRYEHVVQHPSGDRAHRSKNLLVPDPNSRAMLDSGKVVFYHDPRRGPDNFALSPLQRGIRVPDEHHVGGRGMR